MVLPIGIVIIVVTTVFLVAVHQTQSWVDEMLKESWLDKNEIIIDVETGSC